MAPLAWLVRAWSASLVFETTPEAEKALRRKDKPIAFVLWHNRLFLVAEVHRRYRDGRRVYGLVSASKDGAWLDAFFHAVGIHTVRGSSSKGGREAVQGLIDVVRDGHDIGITPDGPRGPRYACKAGAVVVARRVQAHVLVLGGGFEQSVQLRSWDRFHIPRPFSRVRIYALTVDASELQGRDEAVQYLEGRLRQASPDGLTERGVVI